MRQKHRHSEVRFQVFRFLCRCGPNAFNLAPASPVPRPLADHVPNSGLFPPPPLPLFLFALLGCCRGPCRRQDSFVGRRRVSWILLVEVHLCRQAGKRTVHHEKHIFVLTGPSVRATRTNPKPFLQQRVSRRSCERLVFAKVGGGYMRHTLMMR